MKIWNPTSFTFQLALAIGFAWLFWENQVTAFVAPSTPFVRTTSEWKTGDSPSSSIGRVAPWTPSVAFPPAKPTAANTRRSAQLQALPAALSALPLSQKIFLSCFLPTCYAILNKSKLIRTSCLDA